MANEPERDMTPEEREQFEQEQLHHQDEHAAVGPASEPDVQPTPPLPSDAGAIQRHPRA
jgi:hypothetical protein